MWISFMQKATSLAKATLDEPANAGLILTMTNIFSRNLQRARTYAHLLRQTSEQVVQINEVVRALDKRIGEALERGNGEDNQPIINFLNTFAFVKKGGVGDLSQFTDIQIEQLI